MGHFLRRKISWKNFFAMPTLEGRFSLWIFPFFLGGHFLRSNFWGKKFATNCPAYIAKKPGGLAGEGVQGRVWGSTWGDLPG